MKKIIVLIGSAALALLALVCLSYGMGWAFWKLTAIVVVGSGLFALYSKHPRSAKAIAAAILITLAGTWTWWWLNGRLPFLSGTLPYAEQAREVQLSKAIDPGFTKAQAALLLELRKKEDALAAEIPALMQTNNFAQVKTNAEGLVKLRQEVENLLAQMPPPPPTAPKSAMGTNMPPPVSTFTVNQGEIISTLAVPDRSTVYMEADKAFCILEGYSTNPDGSQNSSKLTFPPGKSIKYFAGGGTLRVIGLYTNTTVKLHL